MGKALAYLIQEEPVVFFFDEDRSAVIALVVNVVDGAVGHGVS